VLLGIFIALLKQLAIRLTTSYLRGHSAKWSSLAKFRQFSAPRRDQLRDMQCIHIRLFEIVEVSILVRWEDDSINGNVITLGRHGSRMLYTPYGPVSDRHCKYSLRLLCDEATAHQMKARLHDSYYSRQFRGRAELLTGCVA
jgi:hypothetical protein